MSLPRTGRVSRVKGLSCRLGELAEGHRVQGFGSYKPGPRIPELRLHGGLPDRFGLKTVPDPILDGHPAEGRRWQLPWFRKFQQAMT